MVSSAWVTFHCKYSESNIMVADVYYEDTDDAYLFPGSTADPYNITSRTWLPDPPCRWTPPPWTSGTRVRWWWLTLAAVMLLGAVRLVSYLLLVRSVTLVPASGNLGTLYTWTTGCNTATGAALTTVARKPGWVSGNKFAVRFSSQGVGGRYAKPGISPWVLCLWYVQWSIDMSFPRLPALPWSWLFFDCFPTVAPTSGTHIAFDGFYTYSTTAPTADVWQPAHLETGVSIGASLNITFSNTEPIDQSSLSVSLAPPISVTYAGRSAGPLFFYFF